METSLLHAYIKRMLVAQQACLCTGAGPGRTRLTSSPCPKAETTQTCEDGGDDDCLELPAPSDNCPNSHKGSVEMEVCLGWGAQRGAGGQMIPKVFSACSSTHGHWETKKQGGPRRAWQQDRPRPVSPLTYALQNRSSYSPPAQEAKIL